MTGQDNHAYPILEFDPTVPAVIEPSNLLAPLAEMPERVVLCFFQEVIDSVCGAGNAETVTWIKSELGQIPVYAIHTPDDGAARVAVCHPGVGAPLSAGILEELIALGGRRFIACGGAGVLNREIAVGHVVVPKTALRDEGTSYHYLPPAREVSASAAAVSAIEATLAAREIPYITGKTWTTDAFYRETPEKVARRRAEGCITVEMEAAAFFAVAQFRNVTFGQLLYGGDDVSGLDWDHRGWHKRTSTREGLFWLAVESVARL